MGSLLIIGIFISHFCFLWVCFILFVNLYFVYEWFINFTIQFTFFSFHGDDNEMMIIYIVVVVVVVVFQYHLAYFKYQQNHLVLA